MNNIKKPHLTTNKSELKNTLRSKSFYNNTGKKMSLTTKDNKILTNRMQ